MPAFAIDSFPPQLRAVTCSVVAADGQKITKAVRSRLQLKVTAGSGAEVLCREEMDKRREIFRENCETVARHNKEFQEGKVSWRKKINRWSDLTPEEFSLQMTSGPTMFLKDMKDRLLHSKSEIEMLLRHNLLFHKDTAFLAFHCVFMT